MSADTAKDYVDSQFSGPSVTVQFNKPDAGHLRCCRCGTTVTFETNISYDEQCSCHHDDCLGQMFCNKWKSWSNAK